MLADHAGGDRQDRVGIGAFRGLLAQRVEKLQPRLVLAQPARGAYGLSGLDDDRDHANRRPAFADHRRVIEIHPDLLGRARAEKRQLLILVGKRAAREDDPHDIVVEVGDFGPSLANRRAEQAGMPPASKTRIGVVVDHRALFAPQGDDGNRRAQDQRDGGLDRSGPDSIAPSGVFDQSNAK